MSNLTDLYISASYYGVVNLSDATEPFASQSEGRIYLHDGVGEDLGISLDYTKRVSIDNGLTVTGSAIISGSLIHTGSIDINGNLDVSDTISAGTGSFDTIRARKLQITIESSSVIYNSGSNIFGDEPTDTQVLSGSVYIPNLEFLGTSSVDTETRIVNLEIFSQSLQADFVTDTELSSALEEVTSSLIDQIDTKLDTGSYLVDSSSFNGRIANKFDNVTYNNGSGELRLYRENGDNVLQTITNVPSLSSSIDTAITNLSSSIATTDFNQQSEIDALIAETSSYVRTDTNNTFTGDNLFSGSVQGGVYPITPVSNTASIDCSQGNFFTLLHATSNDYLLQATNITGGRTITLRIKKTNPDATFTIDTGSIKFPNGFSYVISAGDEKEDVITFVSFDTGSLYAVASKNFV